MKCKSAKGKGRRLQQEVAADILRSYPDLAETDVRSTPMGVNGEDVMMSQLAERRFPYAVECKNVEKLNIWKAIEQGEGNASRGRTNLVVFKKNRTPTHVALRWDAFLKLVVASDGRNENSDKKSTKVGVGASTDRSGASKARRVILKRLRRVIAEVKAMDA